MPNTLWRFVDDSGTFVADNPHRISGLYFPLANEAGLMSSVTPNLSGDIKLGQHSFLTLPMSADDLHNSRHGRNFWVYVEGAGAWCLNSLDSDESIVEAGALWHKAIKINKKLGLRIESLNFIPAADDAVELMLVEITNISKKKLRVTPTAAVPIYARSADSLRDHRHVTSLLNRIRLSKYGVIVTPSMTFDERGHRVNERSYFVLGCGEDGEAPLGSFPTVLEFTGEGNNLSNPAAVIKNAPIAGKQGMSRQGKEAMGAIRFRAAVIPAGKTVRYIMALGIVDKGAPEKVFLKYNSQEKIERSLRANKKFWSDKMGAARFSTHDKNFDRWMRWVSIQPVLRKIFGCSFLPDFDYGRGGRGWRDLWQDCLTLLLISPGDARGILINNFGGVRPDGSNATIIGKRNGEFVSDRNNISRVWMDHGVWPFMTLNLYINQSGDKDILFEKAPYFESDRIDTVLGHVLLQHERPFTKIGGRGNFLLEGADWNDGLDMAGEKGESVAFTAAYAGNLNELAALLEKINYKKDVIAGLRQKADGLARRIRKEEWITVKSGHGFFNGYYDNLGNRVEGDSRRGVRMTLTGQVF
ncbi:MAG: cellobiose phosphorylase, partial [Candidatus Omnitrophota bacterium]